MSSLVETLFSGQREFFCSKLRIEFFWLACSRQVSCFDTIIQYIKNQEAHHSKKSFRREYVELLEEHGVDYSEKYLFNTFDENPVED